MQNLAELASGDKDAIDARARAFVEEGATVTGPLTPDQDDTVRHIFRVLHGWYGNLFLSRYITGLLVEAGPNKGEDEGIVNARRMWAFALRTFTGETIKTALNATRPAHPEFPPTCPQFEAICKAHMRRGPAVPMKDGRPLVLEMEPGLISRFARQAREINARHDARVEATRVGFKQVEPGLSGLKQAIANAVGTAGGDEAAELLRLDRAFPEKVSHG